MKLKHGEIWAARKRNAIGLPWTFTKYILTDDKLYINQGVFTKRYDEIELYRIKDFRVIRTFGQRLLGMGTIRIYSSDATHREMDLKNIRDVIMVRSVISEQVERCRAQKGVMYKELMTSANMDSEESAEGDVE